MRAAGRALGLLLLMMPLGSCADVLHYTDCVVDPAHGRTKFTRLPAQVFGIVGAGAGVPIDIALLPVTVPWVWLSPPADGDLLSFFALPSFVLWKVGVLLAAPFDGLEWLCYRAWLPPSELSAPQIEAIERAWDAEVEWSVFPVIPLYPIAPRRPAAPAGG